jgi:ParB family chromosome partitioning protein
LPQEHQAEAFENCWRKDWQEKEAHLLPAKYLSAWIQANLYPNLADAPFDREDTTLRPEAGACVTCPRRSGFNISLFADVQGDQCLDGACFQAKVTAHSTADEKLTGLALRLVLSDHVGIPHESQPDLLTGAEQVFVPTKPEATKAKAKASSKEKPVAVKASSKKEAARKKAA